MVFYWLQFNRLTFFIICVFCKCWKSPVRCEIFGFQVYPVPDARDFFLGDETRHSGPILPTTIQLTIGSLITQLYACVYFSLLYTKHHFFLNFFNWKTLKSREKVTFSRSSNLFPALGTFFPAVKNLENESKEKIKLRINLH